MSRKAAVHEGRADTVLVGLRGLVGQLFREDGAKKVRRGMSGVVRDGRHAGGRAYGYRPVVGEIGRLAIVDDEAAVVRRIFAEYVAGRSPRAIAHDLNHERVAPPRGRAWNASTINGNAVRGSGILFNEIYVGRLVWNKVRMVKDPETGRRISRPNPREEWQTVEAAELALVAPALFANAQERKADRRTTHPSHQRRPRHLLSGLLRCGCCGSGMSTNGRDKSGRVRVRCSADAESGTCPAPRTFYLATIEEAVLSGLRSELRSPEVLAEYVREYRAERQRLAGRAGADRARLERRLGEVNREIERVVDAIATGAADLDVLGPRTKALGTERRQIEAELAEVPETANVVALHPAALERYEEQVARLQASIAAGVAAGDGEPAEAIRELVATVTVRADPSRRGGVEVEIAGLLNGLLGEEAFPNRVRGVWGKLVAEEGLEPPTRGL